MKLKLGQEAKCKVTGFTGIVTGKAKYLTGCTQYLVQPECENAYTYPEGRWFDEGRLQLIGNKLTSEDVKGEKDGCDYEAPVK